MSKYSIDSAIDTDGTRIQSNLDLKPKVGLKMSITTAVGIGGFLLGGLTALICLSILANIKKPPNPSNSSMSPEREEQLRIMAIDVNVNLSRSKMQCALKDLIEEIDVLREQIWSMINKEV